MCVCLSVWLGGGGGGGGGECCSHAELFLTVFRTGVGLGLGVRLGMSLTHNAHIVVIPDTTYMIVDVSCRLVLEVGHYAVGLRPREIY